LRPLSRALVLSYTAEAAPGFHRNLVNDVIPRAFVAQRICDEIEEMLRALPLSYGSVEEPVGIEPTTSIL